MIPHRFERFHYHFTEDPRARGKYLDPDVLLGVAYDGEHQRPAFTSDESAARFYLAEILKDETDPGLRAIASEDEPRQVPDLTHVTTRDQRRTATKLVRFHQTHGEIPVFGADVLVELDGERQLVSINCRIGDVNDISLVPSLKSTEALAIVSQTIGIDLDPETLPCASLALFQSADEVWHLVWHLRDIPGQPVRPQSSTREQGRGLDLSPREESAMTGYLVDAHGGEIAFYYGMAPTATVPTRLDGDDEDGINRVFWGQFKSDTFYFDDVTRKIRTFDMRGADISSCGLPNTTVSSSTPTLGVSFKGPVTAHSNALRVYTFYKDVLGRDGIDDKGMNILSHVGCTYGGHSPEWKNAVWWKGRMWYGQTRNSSGVMVSMARHLDVIAHELTHGVIETSSELIYRDQSGALNESFADIFGVIIRNWYEANNRYDPSTWSWEVGSGLGVAGLPLRDLSDPSRTSDPVNMHDYLHTDDDYGGVHSNSSIHSKAAYNLLTSTDVSGTSILSVEDWAVILYFSMTRLPPLASFSDVPQEMTSVAETFLAGRHQKLQTVQAAIDRAYQMVGI
ncbi:M4 family metallopeptidase [Streptomyces sp. Qhu-G9]|uniref:M4 family metallopeptidase n=1 Tax=Streptomyces sp. Qhu-G9 TaxID=3452799 RepID=UPI0022AC2A2D|nr:M4 family metallopeptidase [Streptomyces aurantiacus]WAU78748.1 M4 family metallopeptidase [Streptomyces aurantiacus]